eukprot:SAG31_NODE_26_length_32985_cov_39.054096_21_plen_100_part_00
MLRASEDTLDNDALTADNYGTILILTFFAAPIVGAAILVYKVWQFCHGVDTNDDANADMTVSGSESAQAMDKCATQDVQQIEVEGAQQNLIEVEEVECS